MLNDPAPLRGRNTIEDVTEHGLVLQVDGAERVAPWAAILSVNAVMALVDRTSERHIPVFVFAIMDGTDERLFLVAEIEPLWERLTSTLSDFLPGMPSIDIWSAELAASGKASLYSRAAGVQ